MSDDKRNTLAMAGGGEPEKRCNTCHHSMRYSTDRDGVGPVWCEVGPADGYPLGVGGSVVMRAEITEPDYVCDGYEPRQHQKLLLVYNANH